MLFGQDQRDGLVAVVFGQTSHEGEGVLAGRPGVIAAFGLSSLDNSVLTALPVDMQLGDAVFGVDGDYKVVDYGPEQLLRSVIVVVAAWNTLAGYWRRTQRIFSCRQLVNFSCR
ncbi:MAG: hypothetical protein ACRDRF_20250 [Pseudonocardiaceae bacterium]